MTDWDCKQRLRQPDLHWNFMGFSRKVTKLFGERRPVEVVAMDTHYSLVPIPLDQILIRCVFITVRIVFYIVVEQLPSISMEERQRHSSWMLIINGMTLKCTRFNYAERHHQLHYNGRHMARCKFVINRNLCTHSITFSDSLNQRRGAFYLIKAEHEEQLTMLEVTWNCEERAIRRQYN